MRVISILADHVGWGHMSGWGWGMGLFGLFFMLLLVGVIVWAVWVAARRPSQSDGVRRRALDLLDERYASGNIEREDYLQRKADLER